MNWCLSVLHDRWDVQLSFPYVYAFYFNVFSDSYVIVEYYCPYFYDSTADHMTLPQWWSFIHNEQPSS